MVYHFIKTSSVANDARLRKWINTFNDWQLAAKIFSFSNHSNEWKQGVVDVKESRIYFRKYFPIGKGRILKIIETAYKCLGIILKDKGDSTFVYHDNQLYLVILFHIILKRFTKNRVVWDMHELPHEILLKVGITRRLLRLMIKGCDYCIVANKYRKDYLERKLKLDFNFFVINNYPTNVDLDQKRRPFPNELKTWLKNDKEPYALWIGIPSEKRNFSSFYEACKELNIKIVILGNLNQEMDFLQKDRNCKILFVLPEKILDFIDHAAISAIFYKNVSQNNFFCEPNRMYLLISRGLPFVAGNNPPIRDVLEGIPFAKVLSSDAPRFMEVKEAISELVGVDEKSFGQEKKYAEIGLGFLREHKMVWEEQIESIKPIFYKNYHES